MAEKKKKACAAKPCAKPKKTGRAKPLATKFGVTKDRTRTH